MFSRSYVKLQGHTAQKILNLDPDLAFTDYNSSLNSPNGYEMMHKAWSSMEKVSYCFSRSSVKFQGHMGQKKSSILTLTECFQTVIPVKIHWWISNYAQSLMLFRRGALLFFGVIHQITRSHRLKSQQFESNLSKITRLVIAIKSLRFALLFQPFGIVLQVSS